MFFAFLGVFFFSFFGGVFAFFGGDVAFWGVISRFWGYHTKISKTKVRKNAYVNPAG